MYFKYDTCYVLKIISKLHSAIFFNNDSIFEKKNKFESLFKNIAKF